MSGRLLYEGKAKKVFLTDNPQELEVFFKDDATAFNGAKKGSIESKGQLNCAISSAFFNVLAEHGIRSHFIRQLDKNSMLVKRLDIIPLELVIRNIAAGSLAKRLGWPEGRALDQPLAEFYYKDDALGDPLINRFHIAALGAASPAELAYLEEVSFKINLILSRHLIQRGIRLVDFKLEFGRHQGEILLGDEISPDTCRFWEASTSRKLDKDRFREDLGGVTEAYQEIHDRLLTSRPQTYRAQVEVRLKDSVLDPQGEAVRRTLAGLNMGQFEAVRVGKLIDLTVTAASESEARSQVARLADELLANPNMEKFTFTLEPAK
jgi:phosphoribosylaminoimidazole-succinocarboxamide synthase